jgi:small subunit ribosomal protein S6
MPLYEHVFLTRQDASAQQVEELTKVDRDRERDDRGFGFRDRDRGGFRGDRDRGDRDRGDRGGFRGERDRDSRPPRESTDEPAGASEE